MTDKGDCKTMRANGPEMETGPWDEALSKLREWDPKWAEACLKMSTNPCTSGVLPRKLVELIGVGLNGRLMNWN